MKEISSQKSVLARAKKGFGKVKNVVTPETVDSGDSNLASSVDEGSAGKYKIQENSDEQIDERVSNRILKRIILFSGIPLLTGFVSFPSLLLYMRVANKGIVLDLPLWLGYVASILTFGAGFIGVSYVVFSSSWDPNREGTFLGWEEAKLNFPALLRRYGVDITSDSDEE